MIWVVLATIGIALWTVAGALMAARSSRRAFARQPGAFRAKLRVVSGQAPGVKDTWPRRQVVGRWVHDVLVIHRGLARARSGALGVASATGSLTTAPVGVRGLGARPLAMTLVLDSGACVQLAAPTDARDTMVGPFIAVLAAEDSKSTAN